MILYLNTECFVLELKIKKKSTPVFVFDIWSVFENYLEIQSNTYKNCQQKVKHCLAQESRQNVFHT